MKMIRSLLFVVLVLPFIVVGFVVGFVREALRAGYDGGREAVIKGVQRK